MFIVAAVELVGPMLKVATKGAITGFVIAGLMSVVTGADSIWEVLEDAAWGALMGAAMAVAVAGAIGYKAPKAKVSASGNCYNVYVNGGERIVRMLLI